MSQPRDVTFSLMTYNLWKTQGRPTHWSTRRAVLLRQLRRLDPDVLLAQELCPESLACVLEALPGHRCVSHSHSQSRSQCGSSSGQGRGEHGQDQEEEQDQEQDQYEDQYQYQDQYEEQEQEEEELFEGWRQEGNIFYRESLFSLQQWGHEHIQQEEELRRLFWVRLLPRSLTGTATSHTSNTILFSTAHFTWQGHPRECESDINLRKVQARHTVAALNRLQEPRDIACFFGGDLNESFWPKRVLEAAEFSDCFSALGLPCRPTHPCRPTLAHEDNNADAVLDWLFARGPRENKDVTINSDLRDTGRCLEEGWVVRPLVSTVVRDSVGLSSNDPHEQQVMAIQPSDHAPVLAVYRCSSNALHIS